MYFHHITNQLECKEADAYWQNDIERTEIGIQPKQSEQISELLNKEIEIFEIQ